MIINSIFKVCFLNEAGFPFQYFLFSGQDAKNHSPREFFSNLEWEYVLKNQLETNIYVCDYSRIHPDDSIHIVKKKIVHFQNNITSNELFTTDDMYLLAVVEKSFHSLQLYKNLTQQDTKPFTKAMLDQLLSNYHGLEDEYLEDENTIFQHPLYKENDVFTYEDLMEFRWFSERKTKLRKIPLGFRFMEKPHEHNDSRIHLNQDLFASNPYDIIFPYVYKPSNSVRLNEFSDDFLFKHGNISENTIYVCLLSRLESFIESKNESVDMDILNIYFPKHESEKEKESDSENTSFWEEQKLVDMIYDIHNYASPNSYKEYGISSFHFIYIPKFPVNYH